MNPTTRRRVREARERYNDATEIPKAETADWYEAQAALVARRGSA